MIKETVAKMKKNIGLRKEKGKIDTLRAIPYKGHMVYIRRIPDLDIFEWLIVFNNQIYSSYMVIPPGEGKKKLSTGEISIATQFILVGAESTIDTLLGEKIDGEKGELAKAVISATVSDNMKKKKKGY